MGAVLNRLRLLVVGAVAVLVLVLGGCGTVVRGSSGAIAPATTDNDFIPTDQNLTDCVGTLEKPNCGSTNKNDAHMYLTFGVLMGGMALIGWRIAVAIRKRDREIDLDERVAEHTY